MNADMEQIQEWVSKAQHDLKSARILMADPEGPADNICFHAQQAAEKILKALLLCRAIPFPRTHDIDMLLDLLGDAELEAGFRQVSSTLTSYAVEARYPGDCDDLNREDAEEALTICLALFDAVSAKLSREVPS